MKKALILAVLFAFIFVVIPAEASSPLEVAIFSPMNDNGPDGVNTGLFFTSGPAEEAGFICSKGTVTDLFHRISYSQGGPFIIFFVNKKLDCLDGSGTIYLTLKGIVNSTTGEVLSEWVISTGTGNYTRLKGEGSMTHIDVPEPVYDAYDLYTGKLHVD